jgi:CheY-like chemotaxis protein
MAQILIVDDDKLLTEMLRRTLSHAGWSVAVANSGTEALP